MSGARALAAVIGLLLGAGCSTDVVDFSLKQELICKEPLDDAGAGCRTCWWSADPKDLCEICEVAGKPAKDSCHVDGGVRPELLCKQSISNCKICWWSDDLQALCKICWGDSGTTLNTCQR